ncbi:MAG: hypothetical protein JNM56_16355 [Planctomycetia bacterium]|nr:hypothetical protein [Planctomycetia bacterium]
MTPEESTDQEQISTEKAECLIIIAPAWFLREDFLDWRQGKRLEQWDRPACWDPQDRDGEYADVFLVFDRRWLELSPLEPGTEHCWEGSDQQGLPDDLYETIGKLLHERGLRYGVLWIKAG